MTATTTDGGGEPPAQWLYRIVPTRSEMVTDPTEAERAFTRAHVEYLLSLRERGILILAGRTQEGVGSFGLVIFEAPDAAAAQAVAEQDPAVAGGVFIATVHPYGVAASRDGLV